ncbi:hypothetical protein [Saccharopolyspora sp. 5N708]|uniref:hypothetical protein n=1 Tax=Saccharopolyspora sp. 5N708 TaxID=3457424 RepID=UPI003FD5E751
MVGAQSVARTRLEQVIRQSRRTLREFCDDFRRASRDLGESTVVSARQVSRWMSGQIGGLPHPATCRVLEHMLGETAEELFGPPHRDAPVRRQVGGPDRQDDVDTSIESEVAMAAAESARFGHFAEQSNVGPHTLEQFRADVVRIVTTYPNRPVFPLFVELRELRDRAFDALEGRQPPAQSRELYLITGVVCGALANASFDLGQLAAAETQARTAFLCAELAGNDALRSWIRGTQSVIAYWEDRCRDAVELAADGWRYVPESGTARVRLAAIEARAHARLRDARASEEALGRVARAREEVTGVDLPGGLMEFPAAKQIWYGATARLWLGDPANLARAERSASEAVELYRQDPPEQRRLGELCLARLDVAVARLGQENLEGAAEEVGEVLSVASRRRTDSVVRRLRQLNNALQRPRLQTTALAADLRDQIGAFCAAPAAPALPEGVR